MRMKYVISTVLYHYDQSYIYYIFIKFQAQPSTSLSIINNKRYLDVEDLFGNTDDINFEEVECKF